MNPLYRPLPNRIARTVLKPFAPWIPDGRLLPVHGPVHVQLPGGQTVSLACNPTSNLAKVLFWRGYKGFEYPLIWIFTLLARRATIIVDVGANIGYYSLVAAAANPSARIFSFEPLPAVFRYLQRSIALNGFGSITAEQVALSDANGMATFYAGRRSRYEGIEEHIIATGGFNREQAATTGPPLAYEVETRTLDAYAAEEIQHPIELLKLDTEATEHIVLRGAERVLAADRPIVLCEVLPGRIERELEAIFQRHRYTLFQVEREGLVQTEHLAPGGVEGKDHVMIPTESAKAVAAFIGGALERS